MTNFKINIAVLLCSVIFFASCEKESIQLEKSGKQTFKNPINTNKDGGGDDEEWIIIRGVVQSASTTNPVNNAEVILYDQNFNNSIDTFYTDALGKFQFENDSGDYAFTVSAAGFQQQQSSSYTFPESNPVTLNLQEE